MQSNKTADAKFNVAPIINVNLVQYEKRKFHILNISEKPTTAANQGIQCLAGAAKPTVKVSISLSDINNG
ncbi:MAG TPA: hypothetical protein DIW64_00620 [Cellvibrio sp.]|nr:hypothetical protein [Cellvibrio sp.]